MMDDFMRLAIQEAKDGLAEGGIPIGSVLVKTFPNACLFHLIVV